MRSALVRSSLLAVALAGLLGACQAQPSHSQVLVAEAYGLNGVIDGGDEGGGGGGGTGGGGGDDGGGCCSTTGGQAGVLMTLPALALALRRRRRA
jgi:uncharacterized protein (TIGR03382 family)